MAGIVVFPTLAEALRAGFTPYDTNDTMHVVRRLQPNGWEQALARRAKQKIA